LVGESEAERASGGRFSARLSERFEIYGDRALPDLRSPSAAAFAAADRERPTANLFALVCEPGALPRHDVANALHELRSEVLLAPLEAGAVEWGAGGSRQFAMVFERPAGTRVVSSLNQPITPFTENDLVHHALPPLVAALLDLFASGATHRAIRPTNLFFRDPAQRLIALGECVSAPPASEQPAAFEPIESAMAMPMGRGDGSAADDLYALGVTLIFLLLGRCPWAAMNDEQLLAEKITRGSYSALLGNERIIGMISEALRGLLADDPRERWTADDLIHWFEGRRLSPKQPAMVRRAPRPLEFGGQFFVTARSLAHAFARSPAAAARAAKSPEFEIWMQRSLADEDRAKMVASALTEAYNLGAASQEERLVARVCTALDPPAPIRYKSIAIALDGFGTAMAAGFRGQVSLQHLAELMGGRLVQFWFSAQSGLRPEQIGILKAFDRLRLHLEDRRPGLGPERVLYEMNPRLHCLSPLVEVDLVFEPGEILPALERASEKRQDDDFQLDRHLAGFIAARFRNAGTDCFDALSSADLTQRILGVLYLLARLQGLKGAPLVPALAQRLARQLPPVVERYHNRTRRARIMAELPRVAARGNLTDLLALVDGAADRQKDVVGFGEALREYAMVTRELERLRIEAPRRGDVAAQLGARYAATAATFLAWLIGLAAIVVTG
jgi:hypothetical protein